MGVFKIATKMLSRDESMRNEIMHLLDDLFVLNAESNTKLLASQINGDNESNGVLNSNSENNSGCIYDSLSNQIACCMWQFLTANVDILPLFTLSQWQTIFDIIAATASRTDFATMKAFEVISPL